MSNIRIIIFFIFALNTFIKSSADACESTTSPDSKQVCYDKLTDDEKDMYKCCYRTKTNSAGTVSYDWDLLDEDDYNYIDGYIQEVKEDDSSINKLQVECDQSLSHQLCLNLFLLLIVLFCF